MKGIRYLKYSALLVSLVFLIVGCSGYGKTMMVRKGMPVTLDELVAKSDAYNVYYHGNSPSLVSGIIFEPKDDEKSLSLGGMWVQVDDNRVIARIVEEIRRNDFPGYLPAHRQIIGPDNEIYGHIYTGWFHVAIKQLDENTLSVYGLKGPPEYEDAGPEHSCIIC